MAGRSRSHGENWWANHAPPEVVRCHATRQDGEQCRRRAIDGSVVCDQHGGSAGQVRRRAAERIALNADAAAQRLIDWMDDPTVEMRERVKIAWDLLNRGGLAAAQVHKVIAAEEDPVEKLFGELLADPANFAPVVPGAVVGPSTEAEKVPDAGKAAREVIEALEASWQPDAEVVELRPEDIAPVGPYATGKPEERTGSGLIPPPHIRAGLERLG